MLHVKLTTEQFIQKAKAVHGNTYFYTKTNYINRKNKLLITCLEHGDFKQFPSNHLAGNGCPKCSNVYKYNTEQFIEKARTVHGNRFDYSKVEYKSNRNKIIIICNKHGFFNQLPQNHLQGIGCPKCRNEQIGDRKRTTIEEFIEKAIAIHGDKYDYTKTKYINSQTKITITCSIHGDFKQLSTNHLQGRGCPSCNSSKGELFISSILKKHNIKYIQEYRIPEILTKFEYDFYLPEYNTLIEYHGIQHYEYVAFLHDNDEDNFLKQKTRDILKKDHAHRFKYRFLEFNYKQFKHMSPEQFEEMVIKNFVNDKSRRIP